MQKFPRRSRRNAENNVSRRRRISCRYRDTITSANVPPRKSHLVAARSRKVFRRSSTFIVTEAERILRLSPTTRESAGCRWEKRKRRAESLSQRDSPFHLLSSSSQQPRGEWLLEPRRAWLQGVRRGYAKQMRRGVPAAVQFRMPE